MVKAHRMALCPNDRQACPMAEHTGWAQVASNWSLDRSAEAWFTGEGEKNEWFSNVDTIYPVANAVSAVSPRRTVVYYWPITNREVADRARLNAPVEGVLEIRRRGRLVASIEATDYVGGQGPERSRVVPWQGCPSAVEPLRGQPTRVPGSGVGLLQRSGTFLQDLSNRIEAGTLEMEPEPFLYSCTEVNRGFPLKCWSATTSFRSLPLTGRFSPDHAHG